MTRSGLFRAAAALGLAPLAKHLPSPRRRTFAVELVGVGDWAPATPAARDDAAVLKALEAEIYKRAQSDLIAKLRNAPFPKTRRPV